MAVCVCMRAPVHFVGLQSATFTQQGRFNSLLSKKLLISAASRPLFFFFIPSPPEPDLQIREGDVNIHGLLLRAH